MRLSLSVRVAEAPGSKEKTLMPFNELAHLAKRIGYHALCMRASQAGVQTAPKIIADMRKKIDGLGLAISMVTGDFAIPMNNDDGPLALRNIEPYLGLAEQFGASLIRVAMKKQEDIPWAQRAADQACERGIRLVHQSHTQSLFETVDGSLEVLKKINRENFGIIYEPQNLDLCGQDYGPETIKLFEPYLFNVYLQNHILRPNGHAIANTWVRGNVRFDPIRLQDRGGIDFELVFEGLKAIGYDGYVTVHQAFSDIMKPEEAAEQSYEYLTRIAQFED
ncbi:sugar phosphate isomerase/epimerase [Candidatus Poribacteria bacterium]|nr:sugar phosphate isomerase/epimerase [Candidatus Poribacteria bacterium]